eukprot:scaffold1690_cov182-Amphora_coffeaeformis.AAC.32
MPDAKNADDMKKFELITTTNEFPGLLIDDVIHGINVFPTTPCSTQSMHHMVAWRPGISITLAPSGLRCGICEASFKPFLDNKMSKLDRIHGHAVLA